MTISYERIPSPDRSLVWGEFRSPLVFLKLAREWRQLPKGRSARPRTVVLLPGFGASDFSMGAIARHLRKRKHRVRHWGLGRNNGRVAELLEEFEPRMEDLVRRAGEPVVAVGWSLGGYIAREAARERPELFQKIITMGSPVVGGPRFTAMAGYYEARGFDLDEVEERVRRRYEKRIDVPVAAIYSKRDGVVAWQACIDAWSPNVRHIEVDATHLAMGFAPEVITIVDAEVESAGD